MTELAIGEVVRIAVVGDNAEEVGRFVSALSEDAELSTLLAVMPQPGTAERGDFGTWEIVQEFVILATSGTTSVALAAGIRSLWARVHPQRQLPPPPPPSEPLQPGTTPQRQQIAISVPTDGVAEITIRLHRA